MTTTKNGAKKAPKDIIHKMKSPLTSLLGYTYILELNLTKTVNKDMLDVNRKIRENIDTLVKMVEELDNSL